MREGLLLAALCGSAWVVGCANDSFTSADGSVADAISPEGAVGSDGQALDAASLEGGGSDAAIDSPVVDPAILVGTNVLQTVDNFETGGNVDAFRFVSTSTGTALTFHFYAAAGSTATKASVGIFSDNGGPSTLLASAAISPVLPGWNAAPLTPSGVTITASSIYWLAVLVPAPVLGQLHYLVHPDVGGEAEVTGGNSFVTFPSPWNAGDAGTSYTSSPISAYVTTN